MKKTLCILLALALVLGLAACGGAIGVILAVSIVTVGGAALDLPVVIKPGVILLAVSFSAGKGSDRCLRLLGFE